MLALEIMELFKAKDWSTIIGARYFYSLTRCSCLSGILRSSLASSPCTNLYKGTLAENTFHPCSMPSPRSEYIILGGGNWRRNGGGQENGGKTLCHAFEVSVFTTNRGNDGRDTTVTGFTTAQGGGGGGKIMKYFYRPPLISYIIQK